MLCRAEIGVPRTRKVVRCPAPTLPGEDYCPMHFLLAKRFFERKARMERFFENVRRFVEGEIKLPGD